MGSKFGDGRWQGVLGSSHLLKDLEKLASNLLIKLLVMKSYMYVKTRLPMVVLTRKSVKNEFGWERGPYANDIQKWPLDS